jgi:hypothetical protein
MALCMLNSHSMTLNYSSGPFFFFNVFDPMLVHIPDHSYMVLLGMLLFSVLPSTGLYVYEASILH